MYLFDCECMALLSLPLLPAGHLTAMLGVFQKLIASKANDVYGFMLLRGILQHLPLAAYQQYMPTVWQLLFTRLQVGVLLVALLHQNPWATYCACWQQTAAEAACQ